MYACVRVSIFLEFNTVNASAFPENIWFVFSTRTRCWNWLRRGRITRRSHCCRVYWKMPTEEKTNWRQKTGRHRAHKHETGSPLALASRCNRIVPRMFLVAHIDFKATFSLLCRSSLLFHTDVLVCTLILVNGLGLGPKDPVQLAVCLLLCFKSCVVKLDPFFLYVFYLGW